MIASAWLVCITIVISHIGRPNHILLLLTYAANAINVNNSAAEIIIGRVFRETLSLLQPDCLYSLITPAFSGLKSYYSVENRLGQQK